MQEQLAKQGPSGCSEPDNHEGSVGTLHGLVSREIHWRQTIQANLANKPESRKESRAKKSAT
jgi:hypothetical protein